MKTYPPTAEFRFRFQDLRFEDFERNGEGNSPGQRSVKPGARRANSYQYQFSSWSAVLLRRFQFGGHSALGGGGDETSPPPKSLSAWVGAGTSRPRKSFGLRGDGQAWRRDVASPRGFADFGRGGGWRAGVIAPRRSGPLVAALGGYRRSETRRTMADSLESSFRGGQKRPRSRADSLADGAPRSAAAPGTRWWPATPGPPAFSLQPC
jgi:hypothetical protein